MKNTRHYLAYDWLPTTEFIAGVLFVNLTAVNFHGITRYLQDGPSMANLLSTKGFFIPLDDALGE